MPIRRHGELRKRWRYVAAFSEELMLCAARVQVGPFRQAFWVVWDRRGDRRLAHTSLRPGGREVTMDGPRVSVETAEANLHLELGEVDPVEAICPSGPGWGWTRKRAGMRVTGAIEIEGRRSDFEGRGVDDESAGYHRRHTSWHWSAGVGRDAGGRDLAWNLVAGINDPPRLSERAIWVEGEPREPAPVSFEDLDGIAFAGGDRLSFASETERARSDNLLLLRSRYEMRFGAFAGSLDGIEVRSGLGVMEAHEAVW